MLFCFLRDGFCQIRIVAMILPTTIVQFSTRPTDLAIVDAFPNPDSGMRETRPAENRRITNNALLFDSITKALG
jgi:hypothetical protein